ncbi:MAG: zf-HC2 domain-containing protein [Candidatus Krumholzibacteriota bacterium]|nr:zf-HC2 domain-containing protein [Candidatus Krumholzibacteriota bacterium]
MNCQRVIDSVQEYLEGRMPRLERNEFVSHVSECTACEEEVLHYREVFGGLRELERFEAPSRVSRAVIAHLKADGRIYEASVPAFARAVERFLALPALARYPLAAALLVAILYVPLAALLGLARGSVTSVTEVLTGAYITVHAALSGVSLFATFFDALGSYARAFKAVHGAVVALASNAGESFWLLGIALVIVSAAVLGVTMVARRKRSSHHAIFGL